MKYKAVVMGLSSGGMDAMKSIFPAIPGDFPIPVIVVQHLSALSDGEWIRILDKKCEIQIKEAEEKEEIKGGNIYIAPPNYHLLVERDHSFSLSIDARVSYARPSIDVLFETAAYAYGASLIGAVLTGANHDGSAGLKRIKEAGGLCIVQDPGTAVSAYMPKSAMEAVDPEHILELQEIPGFLRLLTKTNQI